MASAQLIVDSSEKNADLFYATQFRVPDPFIFVEYKGKSYVVMSDLELDRARREARVDRVLPLSRYAEKASLRVKSPVQADVIVEVLRELGARTVTAPHGTPFTLVDALRKRGCRVEAGPSPFFPSRFIKTKEEVGYIASSQKTVFAAM